MAALFWQWSVFVADGRFEKRRFRFSRSGPDDWDAVLQVARNDGECQKGAANPACKGLQANGLGLENRLRCAREGERPRHGWNFVLDQTNTIREKEQKEAHSRILSEGREFMLHYALLFLIIAIIAAVFGFGGIAGTAAWIAKVLFVVFLILALISFIRSRA